MPYMDGMGNVVGIEDSFPASSKWPLDHPNGGHLALEKVTTGKNLVVIFFVAGGNSHIFWNVHPENLGKMKTHFDEHIFQMGWNQPPTSYCSCPPHKSEASKKTSKTKTTEWYKSLYGPTI